LSDNQNTTLRSRTIGRCLPNMPSVCSVLIVVLHRSRPTREVYLPEIRGRPDLFLRMSGRGRKEQPIRKHASASHRTDPSPSGGELFSDCAETPARLLPVGAAQRAMLNASAGRTQRARNRPMIRAPGRAADSTHLAAAKCAPLASTSSKTQTVEGRGKS